MMESCVFGIEEEEIKGEAGHRTGIMYLPEDVVVDILSRLPVKSLLRFECVSKQWRSSISDHQFAKFQLSRSLSLVKTGHQKFLLYSSGYDKFYLMHNSENPCEKAEDDDVVNIEKLELHSLPFDYENPPNTFRSCDGLLLVGWYGQFHKYFFLWNACLNTCIQVQCPLGSRFTILEFGFCYDHFSNDYKVVIMFINYDVI
ncbi:unnamed protein product [Ilex paraguariensis]|uniref:F-box domain-containing protein n=1 Tax=Ilex paraguariensis TaxID=185542 RepID=A0ABC8SSU7_9AQUA